MYYPPTSLSSSSSSSAIAQDSPSTSSPERTYNLALARIVEETNPCIQIMNQVHEFIKTYLLANNSMGQRCIKRVGKDNCYAAGGIVLTALIFGTAWACVGTICWSYKKLIWDPEQQRRAIGAMQNWH